MPSGTDELRTDLSVRRAGRPAGTAPTMLFLHGLTDSGAGWPGAVAHWGQRFAIVTLDQRGHGRSPRFTAEQRAGHPGDVMVDDVLQLLEQLGDPAVLVGHSMGGAVALAAAVRRPELVRALVLEDPALLDVDEEQRSESRGAQLVASVQASRDAVDERDLLALRRRVHPDWPEDELLVTGQAEQQMDLDYLRLGDYKPSRRAPELLRQLSVPALLVTGDRPDEIQVGGAMERTIRATENSCLTLVRIPDAGHCIRRAQPELFYRAVDTWLEATLPGASPVDR